MLAKYVIKSHRCVMRAFCCVGIFAGCLLGANAETLVAISATPTTVENDQFAAQMIRIDVSSGIYHVDGLVSKADGVAFIKSWNDEAFAVIGYPAIDPKALRVLNFRRKNISQAINFSGFCKECSYIRANFSRDKNGRAILWMLFEHNDKYFTFSVDLETVSVLPIVDISQREMLSEGVPTPAVKGDYFYVKAEYFGTGSMWSTIPRPPLLESNGADPVVAYVNNSRMLAIAKYDAAALNNIGFSEYQIYYKPSRSWDAVSFAGGRTDIRAFGEWIAGAVAQQFSYKSLPKVANDSGRTTGPPFDFRSYLFDVKALGRLILYNARTKVKLEIVTGQPDSEVLGVFDERVYYRVEDKLYFATITPQGISNATLVVRDPAVLDVHWLFSQPH